MPSAYTTPRVTRGYAVIRSRAPPFFSIPCAKSGDYRARRQKHETEPYEGAPEPQCFSRRRRRRRRRVILFAVVSNRSRSSRRKSSRLRFPCRAVVPRVRDVASSYVNEIHASEISFLPCLVPRASYFFSRFSYYSVFCAGSTFVRRYSITARRHGIPRLVRTLSSPRNNASEERFSRK